MGLDFDDDPARPVPGAGLIPKPIEEPLGFPGDGELSLRLVEQDVTANGQTTTTTYLRDADGNIYAELTNGAVSVQQRLYADINGQTQVVGQIDGSGNNTWDLTDHLGSVREVLEALNGNTTVQGTWTYDVWGRTVGTPPMVAGWDVGYAQGLYSGALTMESFGARWLVNGRWLTQDPLGLQPGPNPYEYVGNAPTNAVDPTGLYEIDVHFYMTYYIAFRMGFTRLSLKIGGESYHEAFVIAWADQFVDEHPSTEPIQKLNWYGTPAAIAVRSKFHFRNKGGNVKAGSDVAREVADQAIRQQDLMLLGIGLHAYQDSWSHAGFGPIIGHKDVPFGGHAVDYPWYKKDAALAMAHGTYEVLKRYMAETGRQPAVTWPQLKKELEQTLLMKGGVSETDLSKRGSKGEEFQKNETKGRVQTWLDLVKQKLRIDLGLK